MKNNKPLLFLIFIILTCPFIIKYVYVQHNQYEQIAYIMHYQNPHFLQNDWTIASISQFSPRYYFTALMSNLARIFPLPFIYFGHYLLAITLVSFATFYISKKIYQSDFVAILTVILILYGQRVTLGGNDLVGRDLDPSRLAFGLVLAGIAFLFAKKYFFASFLFSASWYLHPLIGFLVPSIFYFVEFFSSLLKLPRPYGRGIFKCASSELKSAEAENVSAPDLIGIRVGGLKKYRKKGGQSSLKPIFFSLISYLFLSSIAAVGYFRMFFLRPKEPVAKEAVITIITKVMAPFHYSPSSFPVLDYVKFFLFLSLFIFFIKNYLPKGNREIVFKIKTVVFLVIFLCVLSYIFTEIFPLYPVIVLQLFRMTVITYFLMALIIYGSCLSLKTEKIYAVFFAVLPFWIPHLDFFLNLSLSKIIFLTGSLIIAFLIYIYNKSGRNKINLLIIPLVLLLYSLLYKNYQFNFDKPYPFTTPETKFSLYVKENTPKDAIFLIPPYFYRFRLIAQRAVVADWLTGPYSNYDLLKWYERLKDVSGLPPDYSLGEITEKKISDGYRSINPALVNKLKVKYGFNFVVTEKYQNLPFPVFYRDDYYIIYKI